MVTDRVAVVYLLFRLPWLKKRVCIYCIIIVHVSMVTDRVAMVYLLFVFPWLPERYVMLYLLCNYGLCVHGYK